MDTNREEGPDSRWQKFRCSSMWASNPMILRCKETITYACSWKYEQLRTKEKMMEVGSWEREFLFLLSHKLTICFVFLFFNIVYLCIRTLQITSPFVTLTWINTLSYSKYYFIFLNYLLFATISIILYSTFS